MKFEGRQAGKQEILISLEEENKKRFLYKNG